MKGTLFSADFVKDSSNNLRLLELNTDTAIIPTQVTNINWDSFVDLLVSESISDLHIIYKPVIHQSIKNSLQTRWASVPSSSFTEHAEDKNTIYPSSVEDSSDKFILRLAYDESAIFDSEYCAHRLNVYKLFTSASVDSGSLVTQHFYSSSTEYVNTLGKEINASNIPDVTMKDLDESHNPVDFYKIGNSSETNEQRWNGFLSASKENDKLIEQFHYNTTSLDGSNRITSYRTFYIVHGSALETIEILSYKNSALYDIPTDISSEVDDTQYVNKIADHHYYEYTTNSPKVDGSGLLSTDKIQLADDTYSTLADVSVGDEIKSFFISGSPSVETDYNIMNWQITGEQFPSGSYVTSSAVVFKNTENLNYSTLVEYVVDGDSQFSGTAKQFLVYDSGSNVTKYKHPAELDVSIDYFFKADGTLVDLDEVNYYTTTDTNVQVVELDVEDTDTYIISGSTSFNAVVSHNNPCFVAGTQISLSNGEYKNIEDVVVGDLVLTYNHESNETEIKEVENIIHKTVNETVKYTFASGDELQCTFDHPLYSTSGQYVSYKPEQSKSQYGLEVGQVEVDTDIVTENGTYLTIVNIEEVVGDVVVYNLHDVKDNHNFYANKFLVHNRCFVAGTEITLGNGDVKNIEDVVVGEQVLTYNEESGENEVGIVGDLKEHEVNSVIRITLDNEIVIHTTSEHPFYVNGKGWVKASEIEVLDTCRKVNGEESLVSTIDVLDETHVVYNLLSVSENHNFFANGILVHNK